MRLNYTIVHMCYIHTHNNVRIMARNHKHDGRKCSKCLFWAFTFNILFVTPAKSHINLLLGQNINGFRCSILRFEKSTDSFTASSSVVPSFIDLRWRLYTYLSLKPLCKKHACVLCLNMQEYRCLIYSFFSF